MHVSDSAAWGAVRYGLATLFSVSRRTTQESARTEALYRQAKI
jgi:hypothetical protein